MFDALFL